MTASAAGLSVEELRVEAGQFALGPLSLGVAPGRVLVILGPSGAGKTMLIETLAGFRAPRHGAIRLAGREITRLAPEERRIGIMFQDYALFPHLSVRDNVRFGLRMRGDDGRQRAGQLMVQLGIEQLARRKPGTLSGGERQRVALARALAAAPSLMLLDEPLSALDSPMRDGLRELLDRTLHGLDVPSIYVTHDRVEALALADSLAVLDGGRLRQAGIAREVVEHPADAFVARFLGMEILGEAEPAGPHAFIVAGQRFCVSEGLPTGGPLVACYRPEDIIVNPDGHHACENVVEATLERVNPLGAVTRLTLSGRIPLTALVFHRTVVALGLAAGQRVRACIPAEAVRLVPADRA